MSARFLSAVHPAPPGFEPCVLSKRLLLGGVVAVYATGLDEVLRVVPADRLQGVVVTPGPSASQTRIGALAWHVTVPEGAHPTLRPALEVTLAAVASAARSEDLCEQSSLVAARMERDRENTRVDYDRVTGKLLEELERRRAFGLELERAAADARFMADASRILTDTLDLQGTLDRLARLALPALADFCIVDLHDQETSSRVAVAHVDPAIEEQLRAFAHTSAHAAMSPVALDATLVLSALEDADPRWPFGDECLARVRSLGVQAVLAVPLVTRGERLGLFILGTSRPSPLCDDRSVACAEELARRAAAAIENARLYHQAQDAIRLRDEFLSVASHELRTPVTSLLLTAQGLSRGNTPLTPERMHRVSALIERQSARLAGLIDEMLVAGRTARPLRLEPVDLGALVADVAERLAPFLTESGCTVSIESAAAPVGHWDTAALDHVVTNLLSNAVKFGAGKPIEVRVDATDGVGRLTVTDHGIGIAAQDLPRVFDKFVRAVSSRAYGGLGLGLYIVRHNVEGLGGTIRAESVPGDFTKMIVELPLQPRTP